VHTWFAGRDYFTLGDDAEVFFDRTDATWHAGRAPVISYRA